MVDCTHTQTNIRRRGGKYQYNDPQHTLDRLVGARVQTHVLVRQFVRSRWLHESLLVLGPSATRWTGPHV